MNLPVGHFLKNFPWRYYISGGLFLPSAQLIFHLSTDYSAVFLAREGRSVGFESAVGVLPDAPPILGESVQPVVVERSFTARLLSRWRLHGVPQFVLLPDLRPSDFYCNVHQSSGLRENTLAGLIESLQEDPKQVIGTWDETRSFRWSVLETDLTPLSGEIGRQQTHLLILGVPDEYCSQCEQWFRSQKGVCLGIIPAPLACAWWFLNRVPVGDYTQILMVAQKSHCFFFVFYQGRITLVRHLEEPLDAAQKEAGRLINELASSASAEPEVYIWNPEAKYPVRDLPPNWVLLKDELLQRLSGIRVRFKKPDGARVEAFDPFTHLAVWLQKQLA